MPAAPPADTQVTFESRRRAADALARAGRTEEAVERYLELVREYAGRGRLSRAIGVFQSLLALDSGRGATQLALAALFAVPQAPGSSEVDELARTPIFAGLDRDTVLSLLSTLGRRSVSPGETIVREGEPGDAMYVIVNGLVHVVRHAEGGEPRVVDEMEEGDFFGEMALVSRAPRLATVVADTECELLELDRARFEHLAEAHPSVLEVAQRFYKRRLLSNLLRASPLFGLLSDTARRLLVEAFAVVAHPEGTVLLEMGKPGKGLFVLLRGVCGVSHVREDGSEVPYPAMREGDVFGELSLLRDGQVTATVRTLTPCVVLELRRERFDDLLLSDAAVRERIYALAAERYERTRSLIASDALARRLV
jgi:cAMP-dependent protein kinase regulator